MTTIDSKYAQLGGVQSVLRRPTGAERQGADGAGRLRPFEGGLITAHPEAGVHEVHGKILKTWLETGGETGRLGYPTSDVLPAKRGRGQCSCFQHGRIYTDFKDVVHITDLQSDQAHLDWIAFHANPLPQNWADTNKFKAPKISVDYSGDVVYTRTQNNNDNSGGYGCITYSYLHILDILKHWEHPYSPSASWHYAEWFCKNYEKQQPNGDPLAALADHGVASEGHCRTNWDNEMSFQVNPAMTADTPWPIVSWQTPNASSKLEAPLSKVRSAPLLSWVVAKPKNFSLGQCSPSVEEIKHLLLSCGPVITAGSGHAKAIVGYNDLTREFKILDSYIHAGNNFTSISYDEVGPSYLFTLNNETFSSSLNAANVPATLRQEFSHRGFPIPNQVVVSKTYDAVQKVTHYLITASPKELNEIDIEFRLDKKNSSTDLVVYDNVITSNYLAVEEFAPVINIPNPKRLEAPFAYSARIRIANNWRGTYTISIGVEGKPPLVVWTTRGRNLQNVKKTIAGINVDWRTPVEVTDFLDIDVPLPEDAAQHWPPRKGHRWLLTIEDHDRDGVSGTLKEFTLAKRYIHPTCHSVAMYRTETFGGPLATALQDPATGDNVAGLSMENPPPVANPNPGIVKAYVPAVIAEGLTISPAKPNLYTIEIDSESFSQASPLKLCVSGHLLFSSLSTTQAVANKKVQFMKLDTTTCKPYQWLNVSEATTDADGQFMVETILTKGVESYFGVAFYDQNSKEVLASSKVIQVKASMGPKPFVVNVIPYQEIQPPTPWPWNSEHVTLPTITIQGPITLPLSPLAAGRGGEERAEPEA